MPSLAHPDAPLALPQNASLISPENDPDALRDSPTECVPNSLTDALAGSFWLPVALSCSRPVASSVSL